MKHTKEPWRYDKTNGSPTTGMHMIAGGTPGYLAEVRDCGSGDVVANARRIVACVNSCEGVTTEELEQGAFVAGLIEQRDALAEELRNIRDAKLREFDDDPRRCASQFVPWAQNRARYTLEKVGCGDTATETHNA